MSAALTIVYVVLAFRQENLTRAESIAIWALGLLFLVEFFARLFDSPDRAQYFRTHWLDFVTAVPVPGIPGLRVLRLLRLLRLLKVAMLLRSLLLSRGWSDTELVWPSMFLFWTGSSVALWLVEHDAPRAAIQTFGDALLAGLITASTLGFANHSLQPVTESGQIIAAIMVFGALGLWGFASSRLTQLWLQGPVDQESQDASAIQGELRSLQHRIDELTESIRKTVHTQGTLLPLSSEEPGSRDNNSFEPSLAADRTEAS